MVPEPLPGGREQSQQFSPHFRAQQALNSPQPCPGALPGCKKCLAQNLQGFPHPTAPPASAPKAWLRGNRLNWDQAGLPSTHWSSRSTEQPSTFLGQEFRAEIPALVLLKPWSCWWLPKTLSKPTNENEFIFHCIRSKKIKTKKNLLAMASLSLKKIEFPCSKGDLFVN